MTADKRTVATDALETLGMLIDETAGRDAIHLAVEPVVAGHTLRPGEDVGFLADGRVGVSENPVGIVDPFLKKIVHQGERFWLVVYPRQITSLRHVWTHPTFDEKTCVLAITETKKFLKSYSKEWLENYANELGFSYERLMEEAGRRVKDQNYWWIEGAEFEGVCTREEFWEHYEIVTEQKVDIYHKGDFFTCSC